MFSSLQTILKEHCSYIPSDMHIILCKMFLLLQFTVLHIYIWLILMAWVIHFNRLYIVYYYITCREISGNNYRGGWQIHRGMTSCCKSNNWHCNTHDYSSSRHNWHASHCRYHIPESSGCCCSDLRNRSRYCWRKTERMAMNTCTCRPVNLQGVGSQVAWSESIPPKLETCTSSDR